MSLKFAKRRTHRRENFLTIPPLRYLLARSIKPNAGGYMRIGALLCGVLLLSPGLAVAATITSGTFSGTVIDCCGGIRGLDVQVGDPSSGDFSYTPVSIGAGGGTL